MKPILSLLAVLVLAAGPIFAGAHDCAMGRKVDCSKFYANLNLTPEQKSKMDSAREECEKNGCSKESMDKFMQTAKSVLSAEQYAKVEAECAKCAKDSKKEVKS